MATGFVEIADRVYAARYPQWDVGVGLVLGSEGALVVDTRASARQGAEVLQDIRRLRAGIRVSHIVNTHVHFDHTFGNGAFVGARILAHENAARALPGHAAQIRAALEEDPLGAPEYGYTTQDAADVLGTQVRPPDATLATRVTIDLGDREVEVAYAGRGHTDGDVALLVPDARAAFLGDLIEESGLPSYGADSWPLDWATTLSAHLDAVPGDAVVVPGHGGPVDADFVRLQARDIDAVARGIRDRWLTGMPLEEALADRGGGLPYPVEHLQDAIRRGWAHLDTGWGPATGESP